MDTNVIIISLLIGVFLFLTLSMAVALGVIFWQFNKKINEIKIYLEENSKEEVKVMTALMSLIQKEFDSNGEVHQTQMDWMAKNLEKLGEHNAENIKFVIEQIFLQGKMLNKLSALFGYQNSTDELKQS
jgi:predicted PurR-regulated permease PerM